MIKKLKLKFICVNMLTVLIILTAVFTLVLHTTRIGLERDTLKEMSQIASGTMPFSRDERSLGMHIPFFTVRIPTNSNIIILNDSEYKLQDDDELSIVISEAIDSESESGYNEQYSIRYLKQKNLGATVIVFADASSEAATLKSLTKTCLIIGGLSMIAFFLLSLLLSKWAVDPVKKAWDQQRQFVSDASHELKTPLTVIMTNAEMMESGEFGEEDRSQLSNNILSMTVQMKNLVESLLDLARADNGAVKKSFERLDFSKLVSDCVLPFEPLYFENGMTIECAVTPGLSVNGNRQYLRQSIDILIDNARKYSFRDTAVSITLERSGRHCLLTIKNIGQPIPKDQLENIFKRFYRLDDAHTTTGSYGLGLPIARAIVSDHGGRIWAESSGSINSFKITLPLA